MTTDFFGGNVIYFLKIRPFLGASPKDIGTGIASLSPRQNDVRFPLPSPFLTRHVNRSMIFAQNASESRHRISTQTHDKER